MRQKKVLYVLKLFITSALNHRSAGSQIGRVCRRLPPLEPSAAQTEAAKMWEDAGGLFWCSTQKVDRGNKQINLHRDCNECERQVEARPRLHPC